MAEMLENNTSKAASRSQTLHDYRKLEVGDGGDKAVKSGRTCGITGKVHTPNADNAQLRTTCAATKPKPHLILLGPSAFKRLLDASSM